MIRISDKYLPLVKGLLDIKDDTDQFTIHLSPQCERPPYTFHIKVRDIWIPVSAIVVPMEGSIVEIDIQDGKVTVVALPDSKGYTDPFREILQRPTRSFNHNRSVGWNSRSVSSTDDQ